MTVKITIFDLDGTLLNTLPDLTDSTNQVLDYFNYSHKSIDEICSYIGNGVAKLIELSIPNGITNPNYNTCIDLFKNYYQQNIFNKTRPYNDVLPLLQELKSKNIITAVVSNKFDTAVKMLTKKYFNNLIDVAYGENEQIGIRKKPYPDTILKILDEFHINTKDALYIGDSDTDIQTAKNASVKCISVSWGYRTKEFLSNNGASCIIDAPFEIMNYLNS